MWWRSLPNCSMDQLQPGTACTRHLAELGRSPDQAVGGGECELRTWKDQAASSCPWASLSAAAVGTARPFVVPHWGGWAEQCEAPSPRVPGKCHPLLISMSLRWKLKSGQCKPLVVPMELADLHITSQGLKNQLGPSGHKGFFNHLLGKKRKKKGDKYWFPHACFLVWRVL